MKQYMPMKPTKQGIKIWQRCDSRTGYTYNINIYLKKEDGGGVESTLGERVVLKLVKSIKLPDVVLCFDRFFTSVNRMDTIAYSTVATFIRTRKNTPNLSEKLQKRGDAAFVANQSGTIALKWQDKKEVMILSNCHDDSMQNES